MRFTLRPYQLDAIEAVRKEMRAGHRRVVLVAPTGAGKTTIAASIIESAVAKGSPCVFLAHRRELIDQASARLDGEGIPHGIIRATDRRVEPSALVQVASVQTLVRRLDKAPPAKLIIIDEAHHCAEGTSYSKILERYPDAMVIGLTATPWRLDGKGLAATFNAITVVAQAADLVPDYLMEPRIYAPSRPNLGNVHTRRGDYDTRELEQAANTPKLVGDVVAHWQRLADNRRTLVFGVTVAHSMALRDAFLAAGIAAEHVDGGTPGDERVAIFERLRSGETLVVCNVGIASEGFDLPELGCVSLARPTQSSVLYLQMVGRILRPAPGKPAPLILDHADCVRRHGHPLDRREYSLEGQPDAEQGAKRAAPTVRVCSLCLGVTRAGKPTCDACGEMLPAAKEAPGETDDELAEITHKPKVRASMDTKRQAWQQLERERKARGYKPGWSAHRYKSRFGVWPRLIKGAK